MAEEHLSPLIQALAHRGPDGHGLEWQEGSGLIHCKLSTTPESVRESLPLIDPVTGSLLTADARLDNRSELMNALALRDPSISDGGLILAAYRKWGTRCVEHLLGDFSFAIWDPSEQQLYCGRDHLGVRPFYYFASSDLFVFGSEIKAILVRPEVPRRLNEERVADYLAERFSSKDDTFYRDVRRLPAGCCLVVKQDSLQVRRYWDYDLSFELRLPSADAYAEQFHDLLKDAVRVRLRTAYPPGAHLSGGLDSSSLVVLAREVLAETGRPPLHTFTARFPDMPSCDEGRYVEALLEEGGVHAHTVYPGNDNLLEDLDAMLWHQDEPIYWPSWALERALFYAAREAGVRMLMSGHSGDITLSHGDGYLLQLARTGRWMTLFREARAFCNVRRINTPSYLWEYAVRPALSSSVPTSLRRVLWKHKFGDVPVNRLLHPDLDRRVGFSERVREQILSDIKLKRTHRGAHYFRLQDDWITRSFETGDRFSIAYHIRSVYPFFDKRLMEFGLSLPPEQKLQGGLSRIVLRHAMAGKLPPIIQQRYTKVSLIPLVWRSLVHHNAAVLRQFAEEDLVYLDGLVNVDFVSQKLIEELAKTDNLSIHFPFGRWTGIWSILSAVVLAKWLRRQAISVESSSKSLN